MGHLLSFFVGDHVQEQVYSFDIGSTGRHVAYPASNNVGGVVTCVAPMATLEASVSRIQGNSGTVKDITLSFTVPELPCILDTDASNVAIGAVLSQVVDGVERPIAFYSRIMNSAQRNYCPIRRELLVVNYY